MSILRNQVNYGLVRQGLTFFLPSFFWKTLENGTVKHLRMSLHEPALDPNRQRENIESLVAYFKKNAGR